MIARGWSDRAAYRVFHATFDYAIRDVYKRTVCLFIRLETSSLFPRMNIRQVDFQVSLPE